MSSSSRSGPDHTHKWAPMPVSPGNRLEPSCRYLDRLCWWHFYLIFICWTNQTKMGVEPIVMEAWRHDDMYSILSSLSRPHKYTTPHLLHLPKPKSAASRLSSQNRHFSPSFPTPARPRRNSHACPVLPWLHWIAKKNSFITLYGVYIQYTLDWNVRRRVLDFSNSKFLME